MTPRPKVALVVTSVLQVRFFLVPHIRALSRLYDVTLILKDDHPDILAQMDLPARVIVAPIERQIRPWQDLRGLWTLWRLFCRERFDLVHTMTPKAGLLGTVAAWLSRTPVRLHTFQGETWANKTGFMRWLLRSLDWWVAQLATHLTVVSASEREVLIAEGLLPASKSCVLAKGSIGGVDLKRFQPDPARRQQLRMQAGVSAQEVQFLYMGRLTLDKGLLELAQAFARLAAELPQVRLRVVGPDEEGLQAQLQPLLQSCAQRVTIEPYTARPEDCLQAADVLVLPSHREGFGVVIIEAAAMQVPAIASRIYGISDAMVDKQTGLMFKVRDANDLLVQMRCLALDPELRARLGQQARERVQRDFDQRQVVGAFVDYYASVLP